MVNKNLLFVIPGTFLFLSLVSQPVSAQNKTDSTTVLSTAAIKAQLYAPFKPVPYKQPESSNSNPKDHSLLSYLFEIGSELLIDYAASVPIDESDAKYYNFGIPLPAVYRNHKSAPEYNAYLGRLHQLPQDNF